ncbi:metal ABC transporter permease [Corynebacterium ulceribovis]|uniref:metal ABC transporter permease n=1 Tax=Corynebacterium ulceribovis TaxID=487732 RepID=UPI00036E2598|nr:iron chelate uptake ABC transporter family permease subunit [Corynebacterium ulceribovis]
MFNADWWAIMHLPFLEVLLGGALAGLVGTIAVLHKRIFYTEALTHGTFPGAIIGVVLAAAILPPDQRQFLSVGLFLGAFLACIPLAWLMRAIAAIPGQSSQAAAGIVLTFGFALGYFLNKWFQPLPLRIESFLAGSVLTVRPVDVAAVAITLAICLATLALWHRPIIFLAFDRQAAAASGLRTGLIDGLVLALVSLTVVVLIPAMGTILPIALIAAPAAALHGTVRTVGQLLVGTAVAGAAIGVVGLLLADWFQLAPGGVIGLSAGAFYLLGQLRRAVA